MDTQHSRDIKAAVMKAAVICLVVIATFISVDMLVFAQGASINREGGGLEMVSAVLYLVAAVVFFSLAPARSWAALSFVPALMILFAMRELDFDKAFTPAGVLSLKLYSGEAALLTKLISGAFALGAVIVLLVTVWRGFPAVLSGLRQSRLWAWCALIAAGLIVFTKSIDGLGRKLADFGIFVAAETEERAALVEESIEVFIPVFAILAIVAFWKGQPS